VKGIVIIQAMNIFPASPHFTAVNLWIEPTPIMLPAIVCVVLIGIPKTDARMMERPADVSAENPEMGLSLVTLCPIVSITFHPPRYVPTAIVRYDRIATQ